MRIDKFTTRFQQALADAQSAAVGQDNPYIEPQHLLAALIDQQDGTTASLLARGQTNFVRMIWRFNQVYNAERQAAEHSRPTRYEMRLPEMAAPGTLRTESLYIHQPALVAAAGTAKN